MSHRLRRSTAGAVSYREQQSVNSVPSEPQALHGSEDRQLGSNLGEGGESTKCPPILSRIGVRFTRDLEEVKFLVIDNGDNCSD